MLLLDRDRDVPWLVAQLFLLRWSPKKSVKEEEALRATVGATMSR